MEKKRLYYGFHYKDIFWKEIMYFFKFIYTIIIFSFDT